MFTFYRQRGVTLIELILVIGLISFMTILDFEKQNIELEQSQAKKLGTQLTTYNNAARAWLASHVGEPSAERKGSLWLKDTSCGGPNSISYLPCDFPDATETSPIPYGKISLTSTIKTSGSPPNQVTEVITTTSPLTLTGDLVRSDLAGIAAVVAASSQVSTQGALGLTTDSTYKSDPKTAIITMRVRNNGFDDPWLRTDGSNQMHSNIAFDPSKPDGLRQVNNLSRIQNVIGKTLFIGSPGGSSQGADVVIDADQEIYGQLIVRKGLTALSTIKAKGSISTDSSISALGSISSGSTITAKGSIKSDKSISAGESITADKNVVAKKDMYANRFYDAKNNSFYIEPSGLSFMSSLNIKSTLQVNGKAYFDDTVTLNKIVTQNASCSETGAMARNASGEILSCNKGKWSTSAAGASVLSSCLCTDCGFNKGRSCTPPCPSGYNLTSKVDTGDWSVTHNRHRIWVGICQK
ncbi:hypothetical protein P5704_026750 (plasmid) [Pseudomonas sp. FeN3W]|nr:hypothetical protein P5704_026750 [Pseudomonas sp. FeN3W]